MPNQNWAGSGIPKINVNPTQVHDHLPHPVVISKLFTPSITALRLLGGLAASAPGLGERARHRARRGGRAGPDATVPPPRRQGRQMAVAKFLDWEHLALQA